MMAPVPDQSSAWSLMKGHSDLQPQITPTQPLKLPR